MNREPMNVVEWFNPQDKAHLRAWQHLQTQGSWPVEFLPDDVTFPTLWQASIAWKLADLYLASSLSALDAQGGTVCPDCFRLKARSAEEAAKGHCSKWWAVRDKEAEQDCGDFRHKRGYFAQSAKLLELQAAHEHGAGVVERMREALGKALPYLQAIEAPMSPASTTHWRKICGLIDRIDAILKEQP